MFRDEIFLHASVNSLILLQIVTNRPIGDRFTPSLGFFKYRPKQDKWG